jgi:hypothetical protein
MQKQKLWQNVLLSFSAVIVFFTLVEIGTRIIVYLKWGDSERGMHRRFTYEPYLINNDADRPFDTHHHGKQGRFRIVLLGGSTAAEIPRKMMEDSWSSLMHREVEVICLARGGYLANQERISLVLYGMNLEPDLLVTLDGANDIVSATKTRRPGIPYHNDAIELGVNHPLLNCLTEVLRYSQFANVLLKLKERQVERGAQADDTLSRTILEEYQDALFSISVIARGLGIPHIMVLQPYVHIRKGITAGEEKLLYVENYAYRKEFMVDMFHKLDSALTVSRFTANTIYVNSNSAFDGTSGDCFTDEVHLTDEGNRLLLRHIFEAGFKRVPLTLAAGSGVR